MGPADRDGVPPGRRGFWLVPAPSPPLETAAQVCFHAFKHHLNSPLCIFDCLGNVLLQAENLGQLFIRIAFAE